LRLHPRRRRAGPVREDAGRLVGGDRPGAGGPRLPAEAEPAVRLVRAPVTLPAVRRGHPAVPGGGRDGAGPSGAGATGRVAPAATRCRSIGTSTSVRLRTTVMPGTADRSTSPGTPTTTQPAARALAIPLGESSIATQLAGAVPSIAA